MTRYFEGTLILMVGLLLFVPVGQVYDYFPPPDSHEVEQTLVPPPLESVETGYTDSATPAPPPCPPCA